MKHFVTCNNNSVGFAVCRDAECIYLARSSSKLLKIITERSKLPSYFIMNGSYIIILCGVLFPPVQVTTWPEEVTILMKNATIGSALRETPLLQNLCFQVAITFRPCT